MCRICLQMIDASLMHVCMHISYAYCVLPVCAYMRDGCQMFLSAVLLKRLCLVVRTPSPPTKSFPTKSPRVELSGRLPIESYGHENSHPLELRVCLSKPSETQTLSRRTGPIMYRVSYTLAWGLVHTLYPSETPPYRVLVEVVSHKRVLIQREQNS